MIPVAYGVWLWGGALGLTLLWAATLAACVATADAYEALHGKDPSSYVMDEWAGQLLPFTLYSYWIDPFTPFVIIVSFAGFRLFDILKPGPIGTIQNRPGVTGLAGDDLLAGLVATLTGILFIFIQSCIFGG